MEDVDVEDESCCENGIEPMKGDWRYPETGPCALTGEVVLK